MNEDKSDDSQPNEEITEEGQEPTVTNDHKVHIGGASQGYTTADEDELANNGQPQQQTTIVGLQGGQDGEKQIEVVAPQYQQQTTETAQYTSESQNTIEKDIRKRGPATLIVALAVVLFIGTIGYLIWQFMS